MTKQLAISIFNYRVSSNFNTFIGDVKTFPDSFWYHEKFFAIRYIFAERCKCRIFSRTVSLIVFTALQDERPITDLTRMISARENDLVQRQITYLFLLSYNFLQHIIVRYKSFPIFKPSPTNDKKVVIVHKPLGFVHSLEKRCNSSTLSYTLL